MGLDVGRRHAPRRLHAQGRRQADHRDRQRYAAGGNSSVHLRVAAPAHATRRAAHATEGRPGARRSHRRSARPSAVPHGLSAGNGLLGPDACRRPERDGLRRVGLDRRATELRAVASSGDSRSALRPRRASHRRAPHPADQPPAAPGLPVATGTSVHCPSRRARSTHHDLAMREPRSAPSPPAVAAPPHGQAPRPRIRLPDESARPLHFYICFPFNY